MGSGRRPRLEQASLFAGSYCTGCVVSAMCHAAGTDAACGDPAEYVSSIHPARRSIRDPQELSLSGSVEWSSVPRLPAFLPVGDLGAPDGCGLRLVDALQLTSPAIRSRVRSRTQGAVAVLLGKDRWLARYTHHQGRIPNSLRDAGFGVAVAPGFSTWWEDSPLAALVAIKRSVAASTELNSKLPTIPTVVWRDEWDLNSWADWIGDNRVASICIDLGTCRTENLWGWAMRGMKHLAGVLSAAERCPRLVISGPATPDRFQDVFRAWPSDVCFLSQRPWRAARAGRVFTKGLDENIAPAGISVEGLFARNCELFEAEIAAARIRAQSTSAESVCKGNSCGETVCGIA